MTKHIVFISALNIWSMNQKSGAQSLWFTIKGYADRGWRVFFLTPDEGKNSKEKDIDHPNIEVLRLKVFFFRKLLSLKTIRFFVRPFWWIYLQIGMLLIGHKIAKKYKIDLFYGYEVLGVPAAKLLSIKFKTPLVSRFQGSVLKPKMRNRLWKIKHWHHLIGLKIKSDLIIMTNDGTEGDKVLSRLNVDMNRVKFWRNGVNKDIYNPNFDISSFKKKLGIKKEDSILLTVSRLVQWKRIDRIINAMPDIIFSNPQTKLLVVGDGPEKKTLEKLATSLSLNDFVVFLGSLPHEEVFDFYNAADLFISLNDLSNVGNPLLEAMVCGKCIITLNNGDTGKIIKNEENGILLNIEELSSLSNVLCDLLQNKNKRIHLGQSARKYSESHFWTWEERIEAEIDSVENLIM